VIQDFRPTKKVDFMAVAESCTPALRHDWPLDTLRELHDLSLPELLFRAQTVHRQYHDPRKVQQCALLSIKTGACPEDCAYCPQSAHHNTDRTREALSGVDAVRTAAQGAHEAGASRFCMGGAGRQVRDGKEFAAVRDVARGVRAMGMEACGTLGMITPSQ